MKTTLQLIGMSALVLTACSSKEETPIAAVPVAPAPAISLNATAGVTPPPVAAVAPPTTATMAPPAEQSAPTQTGAAVDAGTEHMSDVQRLTYALQLFYGDSSAPAINNFQPLVDRKILARVPVAPAGKKYVIDLSKLEVRLENL